MCTKQFRFSTFDFRFPSPYPHLRPDLPDVFDEKAELPERDADQQYGQRPDNRDKEDINDGPKPVLPDGELVHDLFTGKPGEAPPNCESAKDEEQLRTADLPFFLKTFKHY